jgi:uncharacterized membrane protein
MEAMRDLIEFSALGIEVLAVVIIVVAIVHGTLRYLFHLNRQIGNAYEQYKVQLGKALLLGLEFLVAADIIRTVVLEPTLQNVAILGLLVVVRTFLSWSLVVEMEGRWPWQKPTEEGRNDAAPVGESSQPKLG